MTTEEELMQQDPEYKAYLDAHPMEWVDDLIRNRLMKMEEVPMPSEGIWLWPRITRRFDEKFDEWLKEDFNDGKDVGESNYEAALVCKSIPPKYNPVSGKEYRDGAYWIFRMEIRKKDRID